MGWTPTRWHVSLTDLQKKYNAHRKRRRLFSWEISWRWHLVKVVAMGFVIALFLFAVLAYLVILVALVKNFF